MPRFRPTAKMCKAFRTVPTHVLQAIVSYRNLPPFSGRVVWAINVADVRGVAMSPTQEILVTVSHGVRVYSASGVLLRMWGSAGSGPGQFERATGIAVAKSGEVVVVDRDNHRVQVFRPNGKFLRMWGCLGSCKGQFRSPVAVAITPQNEVVVSDAHNRRVQMFRLADGAFVRMWGSRGSASGLFFGARGLALMHDGQVSVP